MEFLPCSFPHNDFLLLGGDARHAIQELVGLRRTVTNHATIFHNVEGDPSRTVSGVIIRNRTLRLGEHSPAERESISGRYCGIRPVGGGGLELVADELGTIPTYYAQTPKGPMASNSIRLIALAMKAASVPVRLSLASIASTWFTDNILGFTQVSRETYVEGVFLSLLGQRVIFNDGEMRVYSQENDPQEAPKIEEYRYLIDMGLEEIRDNTIAVVNYGAPVVSTLTGGRDSRIVLGSILSLGCEKEVLFSTDDINEADTNISTGLANYFGLAYEKPPENVRSVGMSYEDDLELFTLANMGAKTLHKSAASTLVTDEISMRLNGHAGELYRAGFTKGLGSRLLNAQPSLEVVKTWLGKKTLFDHFDADLQELIASEWLEIFNALGARCMGEAIDLHYANFRNRHHMGAPAQYRRNPNKVLFGPAASPTLFKLARRLPMPAFHSDRLIHDITRAMNFDLAHLPYDKPIQLRNDKVAKRAFELQRELLGKFRPEPELLDSTGPKSREFSGYREKREFGKFCIEAIGFEMDYLQQHNIASRVLTPEIRALIESRFSTLRLEQVSTWLGKFRAARMVAEMS